PARRRDHRLPFRSAGRARPDRLDRPPVPRIRAHPARAAARVTRRGRARVAPPARRVGGLRALRRLRRGRAVVRLRRAGLTRTAPSAHGPVLVTGASSGIGATTVRVLVERGFRVWAGVRDERAAAASNALGEACTPIALDVTDAAQIAAAADR